MSTIGIFTPALVGGGAEESMNNLAEILQEHGFSVVRIGMKPSVPNFISEEPVVFSDIKSSSIRVGEVKKFQKLFRLYDIDFAIVNCELAELFFSFFAPKVRCLVVLHDSRAWRGKTRGLGVIVRWILRMRRVSWASVNPGIPSPHWMKARHLPNIMNYSRVMNARNSSSTCNNQEPARRLLFIGRLEWQKNPFAAVEVAHLTKLDLLVIGNGSLRDALQVKINRLKKSAILVSFCENPWLYASQNDILILTSRHEGKPLVIEEALYFGIPIVTFNNLGLSTLYDDLPVHFADDIVDMVKKIVMVAEASICIDVRSIRERLDARNNQAKGVWLETLNEIYISAKSY